jgi:hypothetical protein
MLDDQYSEPDCFSISPQVLANYMRIAVEQLLSSLSKEKEHLETVSNRDFNRDGTCNSAGLSGAGGIDYGAPPPPRVIPADAHPTQGKVLSRHPLSEATAFTQF